MILGIHGSVRAGLLAALDEADAVGCAALQILPYQRHHLPEPDEIESFVRRQAKTAVRHLIVHSRYVPNLASSDRQRRRHSVALLSRELSLARALGAQGYVLHAGAYSPGATAAQGLLHAADSIVAAAAEAKFTATIFIENVPGGGRRLCGTLEEIESIASALSQTVAWGLCLDTAHAWSAGYDVASAEGVLKLLARIHRLFGSRTPMVFHLNDTRAMHGSHLENHAHWGEGFLGTEGLSALLARLEHAQTVAIAETPKTPGGDLQNLNFLRRLAPRT